MRCSIFADKSQIAVTTVSRIVLGDVITDALGKLVVGAVAGVISLSFMTSASVEAFGPSIASS